MTLTLVGTALTPPSPDKPLLVVGPSLGTAVDVLLTRAAWEPGFAGMLAERAAHPRPSLVLAPTATGVRSDLVARYAGPGRVRLAFLEEMLTVRGGELTLTEGAAGLTAAGTKAPFCRALTEHLVSGQPDSNTTD